MAAHYPRRALDAISKHDLGEMRRCLEEDPSQARPSEGETMTSNIPLTWAAIHDDPEAIELLVAHGADVNFQSTNGHTALIMAAMGASRPTIETLIRLGALNVAARDANVAAISALLGAGADPRQPNHYGRAAKDPNFFSSSDAIASTTADPSESSQAAAKPRL